MLWLVAAVAVGVLALASGRGWERANAIGVPTTFTVTQAPAGPATVQPGDIISYQLNFTANGSTPVNFLYLSGNLGGALTVSTIPGFGTSLQADPPAGSCNITGSSFLCYIGSVGAGSSLSSPLVVNATVSNVADGTTIDLGPGSFAAQDGFGAAAVNPTSDPSALTVANENINSLPWNVTNGAVFEGGMTQVSSTLTNVGSAASQPFTLTVSAPNASVTGIQCPNVSFVGSTGSSTGTCANGSLGPGANGPLTIYLTANDQTGVPGPISVTASAPGGVFISLPSPASVTVTQLNLTGGGSFTVGTTVTVCSTNASSNQAVLAGFPSGLNPLSVFDYALTNSGGASYSGTASGTCGGGQQGIQFTSNTAGSVTVQAQYNTIGRSNVATVVFAASAPVAAKLAFTTQPSGGAVGAAWATQPVVTVQDSGGATVAADSSTVTLSGSGLSCTGGLSKAAVNGVATFAGCAMSGAGTFTVHASDGALTAADSASFGITAPVATKLNFVATPTSAIAGITFGTAPQVEVTDAGGNRITSDTRQISLAALGGPGSLTCTNTTVNAVAGVATFNGCQISTNGSGYYLRATSNPALTQADSAQFSVGAYGTAAKLGFVTQPSGSPAGVAFATQPAVAVQDANGLTVGNNNGTSVTLQVLSGPGTLTCTGGLTKTTTNGVATFAGCYASTSGSYTLRATSTPAYTQADSSSFTVAVGATKVAFTTQPGNGVSGSALATQPVVAIQDSASATVATDSTTVVTLSLGNASGATLTCTGGLTKTAASGVATFAGCAVSGAGTGYTLQASATNLTSATSNTFNVTPGAATPSSQLVVAAPAAGVLTPRSRLTFSATTGTLAPAPTALTFVVKRKSDGKYWNDPAAAWQADAFENAGTLGSGTWTFAITGANRRQFVNMTAVVTAHTTVGGVLYESATKPEIVIR